MKPPAIQRTIPQAGSPEAREQEREAIDAVVVGRAARFYSFYAVSDRLKQLAKLEPNKLPVLRPPT
ncbi:MAG: hypothetical protein ABI972_29425 [Acidobacteriota bacterium]